MIVPYILETDTQAEELTRSLSQRFELLDLAPATGNPKSLPAAPKAPVPSPLPVTPASMPAVKPH